MEIAAVCGGLPILSPSLTADRPHPSENQGRGFPNRRISSHRDIQARKAKGSIKSSTLVAPEKEEIHL